MNKSSRRWKVFVIVLCMLFTMMPGTVFADEVIDPPVVEQPFNHDGTPPDPGTPPGNEDPEDEGDIGDQTGEEQPEDPGTPPEAATPPAIPDPVTPPETATPPAIPDSASPPAVEMNFMMPMTTTCNRTIEIEKIIVNDPGTKDIFTFKVYKLSEWFGREYWDQVRTVTTAGVGIVTVNNLSAGTYKVKEVKIPDYYVAEDDETDQFKLGSDSTDPYPVTFKNTYEYKKGTITIEKKIKYEISGLKDTFTFNINKWNDEQDDWEFVTSASIVGAGTIRIEDLSKGQYQVVETAIPEYYDVDDSSQIAYIKQSNDYSDQVTFENTYNARTITINKQVSGITASAATFTFEIYKSTWEDGKWIKENGKRIWQEGKWILDLVDKVSRVGEGPVIVGGLSKGDYKVVEVEIPNYYTANVTEQAVSFSKHGSRHETVDFINTYSGPTTGRITLIKDFSDSGDIPDPESPAMFTFKVSSGSYEAFAYITGAGIETVDNLTPGAYTITEESIPNDYELEGEKVRSVTVAAGGTWTEKFTNRYDDPGSTEPMEPKVSIDKTVAPYDGGDIPAAGAFKSSIHRELGKDVIYRIMLSCNEDWEQAEKLAGIYDSYQHDDQNEEDITYELLVMTANGLKLADNEFSGFPHNAFWSRTYYYIDTVNEKGIYTNTAYLYESAAYRMLNGDNNYQQAIASSSAIVRVESDTPGPDPDPDPKPDKPKNRDSSTHYYEVTYNPNYPTGTGMSGDVPKDTKDYTYNSTVSVRGNTGDLKAGSHTFTGWNTKADGTGTTYLPGNTFNIKEDTILYAQWKLSDEPAAADVPEIDDGAAAVSAETAGLDDVPKTGSTTPLQGMFLLGLLSLAAITLLGRKKTMD